jgi:hypothetical protein
LWLREWEENDAGEKVETRRLMTGVEKCAAPGIYVPADAIYDNDFPDSFFADLAGNAFCGPVVLNIMVAYLVVLATKARAAAEANGAPPLVASMFSADGEGAEYFKFPKHILALGILAVLIERHAEAEIRRGVERCSGACVVHPI